MNRRRFLATAAALPAATLLGGRQALAEDHLKWAVFTPDHEVTFRTVMKPFAEAVQRDSNGALVFDLFPNGALGRNRGNSLRWSSMASPTLPGSFPPTLRAVFRTRKFSNCPACSKICVRPHGRDPHGCQRRVQGLWRLLPDRHVRHGTLLIHTNFPVNSIADLKGKTIRASSANESAALRALGAVPIGMPVTEIPEAISRGTISGTTSHMSPFFDFGLDRVTNNHFFIGLGVVRLTILMNKKKFDALPEPTRAALRSTPASADEKVVRLITSFNDEIFLKRSRTIPSTTSCSPPGRVRRGAETASRRCAKPGSQRANGTRNSRTRSTPNSPRSAPKAKAKRPVDGVIAFMQEPLLRCARRFDLAGQVAILHRLRRGSHPRVAHKPAAD